MEDAGQWDRRQKQQREEEKKLSTWLRTTIRPSRLTKNQAHTACSAALCIETTACRSIPEGVVGHEQLVYQGLLALLVGHARREVLGGAFLYRADLLTQTKKKTPWRGPHGHDHNKRKEERRRYQRVTWEQDEAGFVIGRFVAYETRVLGTCQPPQMQQLSKTLLCA